MKPVTGTGNRYTRLTIKAKPIKTGHVCLYGFIQIHTHTHTHTHTHIYIYILYIYIYIYIYKYIINT